MVEEINHQLIEKLLRVEIGLKLDQARVNNIEAHIKYYVTCANGKGI